MPRTAKKLSFDDVTGMVAVLRAISEQDKKAPLSKADVVASTGLGKDAVSAAYKALLKRDLLKRIDGPKEASKKNIYVAVGKKPLVTAFINAYSLLFG